MVSEKSEKRRYWANWVVKNWAFLLSIVSLLGFGGYKTSESMDNGSDVTLLKTQITEMASMLVEKKAPRGTIEKHYIENCTKCSELIHLNNVKYHGVKP